MNLKTILVMLMLVVVIPMSHAQLTFEGNACRGDKHVKTHASHFYSVQHAQLVFQAAKKHSQ